MREGWYVSRLEDLCLKIVDCEHKTAPLAENGYPSIRTPNIGKGVLLLENVNRVSEETYKEWTKREVPKHPDLIFAREAPLGNIAIIPKGLTVCLGQRTVLLRPNEKIVNPRFLCYRILSPDVQNDMCGKGGGSTVPHLNVKEIKNLKINFPPLETQTKIASILSGYDDLIENNLKRIKILEEMAQQTYEEWFVRMRFPGYESSIINSETGLPEGWAKVGVNEFAKITFGYPFKAKDFNSEGEGYPIIRIRNIPKSQTSDYTIEEVDDKYIVNNGDILIGMDGEFYLNFWTGNKGYLVQRVCRLQSKVYDNQGYLLEALRAPINYYQKSIDGATVAHLGKKHLDEIEIVLPNLELSFFQDLMKQKINLANQNQHLQEARDILLPRLMMGLIEV